VGWLGNGGGDGAGTAKTNRQSHLEEKAGVAVTGQGERGSGPSSGSANDRRSQKIS